MTANAAIPMKMIEEARQAAAKCGLDFDTAMEEHLRDGFVWCSPDCFILAMESWKDFESDSPEPAWFVTLAVGDVGQFVRLDPKPDKKWLGFQRNETGPVHWLDYQAIRQKHLSHSQN